MILIMTMTQSWIIYISKIDCTCSVPTVKHANLNDTTILGQSLTKDGAYDKMNTM